MDSEHFLHMSVDNLFAFFGDFNNYKLNRIKKKNITLRLSHANEFLPTFPLLITWVIFNSNSKDVLICLITY